MITKYKSKNFQITINPLPNNCNECPFYLHHTDDEYGGYDYDYCQFGAKDEWNVFRKRAKDCPL